MRAFPLVPAACIAALGVAAVPHLAAAVSPVVIEGVDDEMRDTIRDLLPDRERPTSLFDAERLSEEAAARAMVWLRSEGYYGAEITPEASDEPPQARIVLAPGPRFSFADPQLAFVGDEPDSAALDAVAEALARVRSDAPGRAADVLQAEGQAVTALQRHGYADARAGERRVVVDHAANELRVEFNLDAGDLARLGAVRAEPSGSFRPSFIANLQNWDTGERYTPQMMSRLRRDITTTGAVAFATTRLAPPGPDGLRDVILELEPSRRHAYEVGFSYSTSEGVGFQAEWTRRNLTRRADSLTVTGTLAELQQSLTAELLRPHSAGLGHSMRFGASVGREDLDAYTRSGVAVYASVDASNRLRVGRGYGLSLSADRFDETTGVVREAVVLSGFASVRNDSTEFTLDPTDGSIVALRLEPSISTGDRTLGFVRAIADGRIYETFGDDDRLTLAARLRAGWLEAVSGDPDNVPPDRRFYAGGGGSVRGYAYNSLYPRERDLLGLTPGGQGLVEGSIEARWRSRGAWGAVAFVDGGTAFDDWSDAGDLSWGVGVGVRYNLGFAPLRVDIAAPLDRDATSDDYALYISIGQAF
jgi:translocation and assembly module TamA